MSTESDLASLFADSTPTLAPVELQRVLRRSSRRRGGQRMAIGGATTLAVAGIGVASVAGIRGLTPSMTSGGGTSSLAPGTASGSLLPLNGGATDGAIQLAPASRLNLCGGTVAEVAPSPSGLVLSPQFDSADASSALVTGTVTLTNTGAASITGSSAVTPEITLSKDGRVLWHSNGAMIAMARTIELAPGASTSFTASFAPVTCGVEDDESDLFRENLPHVAPGVYQVSAALDVTRVGNDPQVVIDLVTGARSSVTLR